MRAYKVCYSSDLGRYLVATRDIKEREIIIREDPLISGPSDRGPQGLPVCLGCSCLMFANPTSRCTTCRWPVCNADCEKLPAHALNECRNVFQKNRVMYPPPYGWPLLGKSICILRCLLLKEQEPAQWEQLMKMADNGEVRRGKPTCILSDKRILENFYKFYPGESSGGCAALEEEVIRISGIIDTNAHAFPIRVKGVATLTLTIRSNLPIAKGAMITVAYDEAQLVVCTLKRLVPNEINGMFICKCERCSDPTELGTYIAGIKCPQCSDGYLLPIDSVDSFSSWKCDNGKLPCSTMDQGKRISETEKEDCCSLVLDEETIVEMLEEAEMTCGYSKMKFCTGESAPASGTRPGEGEEDETLELLKEFVKDYSGKLLHPNHYILLEVNVRILKMEYGKGLSNLSDDDLILYLDRCERLLEIADILTPGYCELRAFLQFHFSQGLLNWERRKEGPMREQLESEDKPAEEDQREGDRDRFKDGGGDSDDGESDSIRKQDPNPSDDNDTTGPGNENYNGSDYERVSGKMTMKASPVSVRDYGNHSKNLMRITEMLRFLLTFFAELNPSHRLLEPIRDTLEEAEQKLKIVEK